MRNLFVFGCLLCALLLHSSIFASDKQSGTDQYSTLRFTVVKDDNNKPVRNASVVLHPVEKNGKQGRGGFQLKTDNDGKTETEGIPFGALRIQVLAPGFQTFGDDYDINKPEMDIQIRLQRPKAQVSAYDKLPDKQRNAPATPPAETKPQ